MNISRENIDELNAVVKVDIEKDDYKPKVDKILKDYRKTANIPGFRKGHVPMGLVKKQYGQAVLVDEVNKLLQESLNNYLTEEKLDVLGNPLPKDQEDFSWDKEDYTFEFELGLAPDFTVNLDTKEPITHYKIVADKEMIDNQIESIRKQYGKLKPKDKAEEGDMVAGVFKNNEEDIDNVSTVSLENIKGKMNLKKFLGSKVGDTLKLKSKNLFENDADLAKHLDIDAEKAGDLDVELTFDINEINTQELAEMNEELFGKIFGKEDVKTEEDFRQKIKEDAEKQFEQQSDQQLLNDVTEALIEQTQFDLPDEFLQKWIQVSGEKDLSPEEAKEEYEHSQKGLRFQLIENKLVTENDLQVQFEEVKEMTKERIKMQMAQFGQMNPSDEELDNIAQRVLSNEEEARKISEQVKNQKLLKFYKENVNLKDKEVTYDEFVKAVYE